MLAEEQQKSPLGQTQRERFQQDGFVMENDIFSLSEVETLRQACAAPEDRQWETADQTIHSLGITARHPAFLALARDPRIVERLIPLLGPDIQLQHSKLAAQATQKGKGGFGWHQDFAFFPHTNMDLIAVMVMLDDATPDNGCMRMVRGSHRLGLLNHANDKGLFTGSCQERIWEAQPENVAPVTPRVGGISIHHCLTVHGSGPNPSGMPRRGIVFQYRADDAYQLADSVWADTGLLISGQRREHVRCEAATLRLPRSTRDPAQPFGGAWNQKGTFACHEDGP
jgi:phytanoyl-CoA hydroxylase